MKLHVFIFVSLSFKLIFYNDNAYENRSKILNHLTAKSVVFLNSELFIIVLMQRFSYVHDYLAVILQPFNKLLYGFRYCSIWHLCHQIKYLAIK